MMKRLCLALCLLLAAVPALAAPPAIDGITTWQAHSGNSAATMSLTTTSTNDIIVVGAFADGGFVTSVSDTMGLSWSLRKTNKNGFQGGSANPIEEWVAQSTLPLVSDTITVNVATSSTFVRAGAFGVSGANLSSPIDPGTSAGPAVNVGQAVFSTYLANDLVIALYRFGGTSSPTAGTGFTAIINPSGTFGLFEYKQYTSTQSSATAAVGTGSGDIIGGVIDAFTADTDTTMRASKISAYPILQVGTPSAMSASKTNAYDVLAVGTASAMSVSKMNAYVVLKTIKPAGFFHPVPQ